MGEDRFNGMFERRRQLLAGYRKNMLGREDAKGEIPGIGELEHLLYVQDEMVEPALAHEAGGEQKLAAGAPEIGYCKTGDPLAPSQQAGLQPKRSWREARGARSLLSSALPSSVGDGAKRASTRAIWSGRKSVAKRLSSPNRRKLPLTRI